MLFTLLCFLAKLSFEGRQFGSYSSLGGSEGNLWEVVAYERLKVLIDVVFI